MRDLLKQFGGDYRLALAAYNAGPGNVRKYGGVPPIKETQNYVNKIMGGGTSKGSPQRSSEKAGPPKPASKPQSKPAKPKAKSGYDPTWKN